MVGPAGRRSGTLERNLKGFIEALVYLHSRGIDVRKFLDGSMLPAPDEEVAKVRKKATHTAPRKRASVVKQRKKKKSGFGVWKG